MKLMKERFAIFILCVLIGFLDGKAQINSIRVAHFNIGQLSMGRKEHSVITQGIREQNFKESLFLFSKISPDIFCFCEFPQTFTILQDSTENIHDPAENALLMDYSYFYRGNKNGKRCNAIASRNLILSDTRTNNFSEPKGREYLETNFEMCDKRVKLVECHLEVPKFRELRAIQMKELISAFEHDKYVILCGDFNVAETSEYQIFIENGYKMANHGMFGDIITHPWKKGGGSMLDNIICKGFDIIDVQVYYLSLSDHFAIACDLIINR